MKIEEITKRIIYICKENNFNKIYICGNGCSGKTTLSKKIQEEAIHYGNVNLISTDDFLVNTILRKNGISKWTENEVEYIGRYTSSNYESYFWKNIYELIYNIDHGVDCFYFPKRYKEKNNIRQLKSEYFLTIIEGVGTVFLDKDKDKSLTIFLKCNTENEIQRRKSRTEQLNRNPIELYSEERSSQYRVNILSHENEFDLIIENDEEFNYKILDNKGSDEIEH